MRLIIAWGKDAEHYRDASRKRDFDCRAVAGRGDAGDSAAQMRVTA
jgi:hypothetical protein